VDRSDPWDRCTIYKISELDELDELDDQTRAISEVKNGLLFTVPA